MPRRPILHWIDGLFMPRAAADADHLAQWAGGVSGAAADHQNGVRTGTWTTGWTTQPILKLSP